MNRAILAGSVIVGIAVMMSIFMIAPAFAANPWKDLFFCNNCLNDPLPLNGTEYKLISLCEDDVPGEDECVPENVVRVTCTIKRGAQGHIEFKDQNPYDGLYQEGFEQERCHKSNFWIDAISFVVPVV